jgi:hypothetical protein
VEALPGERVEEARCVPDEEPVRPRPPFDAMPDRRRTGDPVERRTVPPPARIAEARRDGRDDRTGDPLRAIAGEARPPRRTEDDADVHPAAGHRRDADVAVADEPHPRVDTGLVGTFVGKVVREPDPWCDPGRSGDPGGTSDDGSEPIRADDDPGAERRLARPGRGGAVADRHARGDPGSKGDIDDGRSASHLGARRGSELEEGGVEG